MIEDVFESLFLFICVFQACDDVIVLNRAGLGSGFFLPFHLTIAAMLSRLIVFLRAIFAALRKFYAIALKIALVPVLSIREVWT